MYVPSVSIYLSDREHSTQVTLFGSLGTEVKKTPGNEDLSALVPPKITKQGYSGVPQFFCLLSALLHREDKTVLSIKMQIDFQGFHAN